MAHSGGGGFGGGRRLLWSNNESLAYKKNVGEEARLSGHLDLLRRRKELATSGVEMQLRRVHFDLRHVRTSTGHSVAAVAVPPTPVRKPRLHVREHTCPTIRNVPLTSPGHRSSSSHGLPATLPAVPGCSPVDGSSEAGVRPLPGCHPSSGKELAISALSQKSERMSATSFLHNSELDTASEGFHGSFPSDGVVFPDPTHTEEQRKSMSMKKTVAGNGLEIKEKTKKEFSMVMERKEGSTSDFVNANTTGNMSPEALQKAASPKSPTVRPNTERSPRIDGKQKSEERGYPSVKQQPESNGCCEVNNTLEAGKNHDLNQKASSAVHHNVKHSGKDGNSAISRLKEETKKSSSVNETGDGLSVIRKSGGKQSFHEQQKTQKGVSTRTKHEKQTPVSPYNSSASEKASVSPAPVTEVLQKSQGQRCPTAYNPTHLSDFQRCLRLLQTKGISRKADDRTLVNNIEHSAHIPFPSQAVNYTSASRSHSDSSSQDTGKEKQMLNRRKSNATTNITPLSREISEMLECAGQRKKALSAARAAGGDAPGPLQMQPEHDQLKTPNTQSRRTILSLSLAHNKSRKNLTAEVHNDESLYMDPEMGHHQIKTQARFPTISGVHPAGKVTTVKDVHADVISTQDLHSDVVTVSRSRQSGQRECVKNSHTPDIHPLLLQPSRTTYSRARLEQLARPKGRPGPRVHISGRVLRRQAASMLRPHRDTRLSPQEREQVMRLQQRVRLFVAVLQQRQALRRMVHIPQRDDIMKVDLSHLD